MLMQAFFLSLTQVGRYLKDSIRRRQGIEFGQTAENVHRQLAATGPVFKYLATIDLREDFGALARDDASEDGRYFRGRDEIACFAELCRTRRVVTESRRIQRMLHVLRETDVAACVGNTRTNKRRHTLAVRGAVGIGFRQRWRQIKLHVNIVG